MHTIYLHHTSKTNQNLYWKKTDYLRLKYYTGENKKFWKVNFVDENLKELAVGAETTEAGSEFQTRTTQHAKNGP